MVLSQEQFAMLLGGIDLTQTSALKSGGGVYIHAERLLAKAGGSKRKGRGIPTLETERKGRSAAEVCTSEARKIGETPCGREGRSTP